MAHPSHFRNILVPLDGSPLAEQALPLARRIAQLAGGKLRLVLVHQIPSPLLDSSNAALFVSGDQATRKAERSYLRAFQARLRQEGVRLASAVTLNGPVGPTLAQYAQEVGIDLVVMATHGRGGARRAWLGSVADHLIRHLEVPVFLVRASNEGAVPMAPAAADQILVPLDGSPLAEEALGPAADLARLWGAALTLLRVVLPVVFFSDEMRGWPAPYDTEYMASLRSRAEDYVRDLAEGLRGEGVRASGVASFALGAADAILELGRPGQVAAIAIATYGHGGLKRLALGSVADKLIRGAQVPVLVLRPARSAVKKSRRTAGTGAAATGDR
jgi:nucleotide-binding universal stress UspA family protein